MRNYILILLFVLNISMKAQIVEGIIAPGDSFTALPKITPPSPEAFKLGNYGNVPVGLSTGSINLNIPLNIFKTKNVSLPIDLFYSTNGIKVDDTSGNTGLGWGLNFGGVISRTVRDLPDEDEGYLPPPNVITSGLLSSITNTFLYLGGDEDLRDTEADNFSFNFNGISGKFILDENRNVILESKMNLKFVVLPYDQGFVITDTNGIKYYLTETEKTMFRVSTSGPPTAPSVTAWYLSKIVHPQNDIIYFNYTTKGRSMITSQSQDFSYKPSQGSCGGESYGGGSSFGIPINQTMTVSNGKRIESIKSNNPEDGMIVFSYDSTPNGNQDETGVQAVSEIIKYNSTGYIIEKNIFSYLKTLNQRLFLTSVKFKDQNREYKFEYLTPQNFPERLSKSQDHWGYYNGQINNHLFPKYNLGIFYNNTYLQQIGANKDPYENFTKIGVLQKIFYPTKGLSEFSYESNSDNNGNKGGGIRIKSIRDLSSENDISGTNYRRFYYSSGDLGQKPIYYSIKTSRINCTRPPENGTAGVLCYYKDVVDHILTSSSMISLFESGSSSTFYKNVTISYGGDNFEKGKEEKEFIINRNIQGHKVYGENDIVSSPFTNSGWNNGLEIKNEIFLNQNNNLNRFKTVINDYEIKNISERRYYTFRKNYDLVCSYDHTHKCTQEEVSNYPLNPCYGKNVNAQVILHDISNIDAMEYKNISNQHYLKSQKTTDYLNGKELKTTTEYFYDNPSHYQLTSEKTTFPDKSISESSYQYALEKGKTDIIAANMVGIPFETTVVKKQDSLAIGKVISKSGVDYTKRIIDGKDLILPNIAYSYDIQNPSDSLTQVKYNLYDNKGNLLQYTLKPDANGNGGTPTAIIWGYNQTQPIAKIEGAKLSDIPQGLITTIVNASDYGSPSYSEAALLTQLDAFRTGLPNYQISTYTYKPLIGVTTITPPSGIREIYNYDTANRLQSVVDIDGNILKEYKYNYKP